MNPQNVIVKIVVNLIGSMLEVGQWFVVVGVPGAVAIVQRGNQIFVVLPGGVEIAIGDVLTLVGDVNGKVVSHKVVVESVETVPVPGADVDVDAEVVGGAPSRQVVRNVGPVSYQTVGSSK